MDMQLKPLVSTLIPDRRTVRVCENHTRRVRTSASNYGGWRIFNAAKSSRLLLA